MMNAGQKEHRLRLHNSQLFFGTDLQDRVSKTGQQRYCLLHLEQTEINNLELYVYADC